MISNIKKCKIVSFVGLAKNVGKTTALNHFLRQLPNTAVTSVGIDEFNDCSIDGTKKPKVFLEKGAFFTATEESLHKNSLAVKIIEKTDSLTPLGHIIIAQAQVPGFYEIYGLGSLDDTKKAAEKFLELGAERVFIDGAFFRMTPANISSGCVLVAGSNANANAGEVIKETKNIVEYFNFEKAKLKKSSTPYIVEEGKVKELGISSILLNEKKAVEKCSDKTSYLYIPGAFAPATFEAFKKLGFKFSQITIVIEDGTRCFLSKEEYGQFLKMGGRIKVLNPINICGIAVNSFSTFLKDFEPKEFLRKMREELKPLKVEDVLLCS